MGVEEKLRSWTSPSSGTEQDKQDRTVRMVMEAVRDHDAFDGCDLSVYAKGSYANNTNVKADSDVDIVVQCHEVMYWNEATPGAHGSDAPYTGIWTPSKLRNELAAALGTKFGNQVDSTGQVAIQVNSSTARMDADVVPCFDYRYFYTAGSTVDGTRVVSKSGRHFENYPAKHLANGRSKNTASGLNFKKAVRVIKRLENEMVTQGAHREVPSYFIECLVYNCSNSVLQRSTWVETVKGILVHVWDELQGDSEPATESDRWMEVNGLKFLFDTNQKWSRKDGRDFAYAAWNHLGFA